MVSTAVVNSIACKACFIDNSCVPFIAKDLAARTRKWQKGRYAEKDAKLVFHVEDSSVLSRPPKVLFRMLKYESNLQALLVALHIAARKKLRRIIGLFSGIFHSISQHHQSGMILEWQLS